MSEFTARLEQTRKKLLDLTKRNKLLNYKKPAKSRHLKIIDESPQFIYNFLVFEDKKFKFKYIPEPELLQLEHKKLERKIDKLENTYKSATYEGEKKAALHQIEKINESMRIDELSSLLTAEEQAVKLGFNTSTELPEINLDNIDIDERYTDNYLQTLHYAPGLEKILKKIELDSRNVIEETGSNMLYMILGVLEWYESGNSDIPLKSPLISIPVLLKRGSLSKATNTYEYTLEYSGESIDTNQSLAEKLKTDFNIHLPELTEEMTFNEYMSEVKKVCHSGSRWTIKQEISLDFLQYNKILMYKDLEFSRWSNSSLEDNQVLSDFFLGKEESCVSDTPIEYEIDEDDVAKKIPLVMDADSSQHSAIVDVLNGRNIVIEGPPGTGKSQTIANMIAALLSEGKNVLFVSEKMAALDVVHKRLSNIGLADFCLELHSHKTQKTKVLESIKKRIEGNYSFVADLDMVKQNIQQKKNLLKEHIDILHTKIKPTNMTIFEIFWQVEKNKYTQKYLDFIVRDTDKYTMFVISETSEILKKYSTFLNQYDFKTFYWNGIVPVELDFISIDAFLGKIYILETTYKKLSLEFDNILQLSDSEPSEVNIENEAYEAHRITSFLSRTVSERQNVSAELLRILSTSEAQSDFKATINLYLSRESIWKNNQESIINYNDLSSEEIEFIAQLEATLLIDLENLYITPFKKRNIALLNLEEYVKKENISELLIDKLKKINSFLYEDIDIATIRAIFEANETFIGLVTKIERLNKELNREFDIPNPADFYVLKDLAIGISKIDDISEVYFASCSEGTGTSNHQDIIIESKNSFDYISATSAEFKKIYSMEVIDSFLLCDIEKTLKIIIEKKDSLFKIFSKEYRSATNALSLIYKDDLPISKEKWIFDIEDIIDYKKRLNMFNENKVYSTAFGKSFKGMSTDWEGINKANIWSKTIRENIKSQKLIKLLLSGDSQVYYSLKAISSEYSKSVSELIKEKNTLEMIYKNTYLSGIYRDFEDAEIKNTKDKFIYINDSIVNYLGEIEGKISTNVKIDSTINCLSSYLEDERAYRKGLQFAQDKIHELTNKNPLYDSNFINNILSFLSSQNFQIGEVKNMLEAEKNICESFNNAGNLLRDKYQYLDEIDEKQNQILNGHIVLIKEIENTFLDKGLKNLILTKYDIILEHFLQINNLYGESINAIEDIESLAKVEEIFLRGLTTYHQLYEKLMLANENKKTLSVWLDYNNICKKIEDAGLAEIVKAVNEQLLPKDSIVDVFIFNLYNSLVKNIFRIYPSLKEFSRVSHEESIDTFRRLDKNLLNLNKKHVARMASLRDLPPSQAGGAVRTFTNKRLLDNEISKKKRHIPIRQLINRAGKAIQALKPCFMMSPLSVAQYLSPDAMHFDVVLIDEASQLRPEEALGVIARSDQIVIVGDPKQLPPTSFFNSMSDELSREDETILGESESILDSCIDLYSPIRRLKWHYRSQHETLIDFSNKQFYDNDLIIFPSPTSVNSSNLGVKYTYIEKAVYQSGASQRFNKTEARKLVSAAMEQMRSHPEKSLGIGTLNTSQRDLIQQMVDDSEKLDSSVSRYIHAWKDSPEPFFIKNLESLQGDERDVIFISTTYGPDKETKQVMQRFGPINQEMGWRRLNVLLTRSKQKMHIFTSMLSSDILISPTSSQGVRALKSLLHYLETGILTKAPEVTERGFDSPFEESVYELLDDIGIKTVPQVGVAGYFIDLAVVSENNSDYILAIECDGATYHSSRSARDRDRLKDEVLKKLGWHIHRIWSVDWYKNRDNEVSKLIEIIQTRQKKHKEKTSLNISKKNKTENIEQHDAGILKNETKRQENKKTKTDNNRNLFENNSIETVKNEIPKKSQFYSDDTIKEKFVKIRTEEIAKNFVINESCILSPVMIDQFISHKPIDMDEFRTSIPMPYRLKIEREQLIYMNKIFEILEMAE